MGICYDGPCYIFGNNQSMLTNSSDPDSKIRKISNSIAYKLSEMNDDVPMLKLNTIHQNY